MKKYIVASLVMLSIFMAAPTNLVQAQTAGDTGVSTSIWGFFQNIISAATGIFKSSGNGFVQTTIVETVGKTSAIVVPVDAKYAVIKAWGGAAGRFGNDGRGKIGLNIPVNFLPGGHGGYVSGIIEVNPGDTISVTPGEQGAIGARKGDDNDWGGSPGTATRVSFGGQEILVAGAGAPLLMGWVTENDEAEAIAEVNNAKVYPPQKSCTSNRSGSTCVLVQKPLYFPDLMKLEKAQAQAYLETLRSKYLNGGSPNASKEISFEGSISSLSPGVTYSTLLSRLSAAKIASTVSLHTKFANVGGDGKEKGSWTFVPTYSSLFEANFALGIPTGGTSWVDSSIVKKPLYYSGSPYQNTLDGNAWRDRWAGLTVDRQPGFSNSRKQNQAGGAVIVDFWKKPPATPNTVTPTSTPVAAASISLSAKVNGTSVSQTSLIPDGTNVDLTVSSANMPVGANCVLGKASTGGTPFSPVSKACASFDGIVTRTGALTAGDYTYSVTGSNGTNASVSFVAGTTTTVVGLPLVETTGTTTVTTNTSSDTTGTTGGTGCPGAVGCARIVVTLLECPPGSSCNPGTTVTPPGTTVTPPGTTVTTTTGTTVTPPGTTVTPPTTTTNTTVTPPTTTTTSTCSNGAVNPPACTLTGIPYIDDTKFPVDTTNPAIKPIKLSIWTNLHDTSKGQFPDYVNPTPPVILKVTSSRDDLVNKTAEEIEARGGSGGPFYSKYHYKNKDFTELLGMGRLYLHWATENALVCYLKASPEIGYNNVTTGPQGTRTPDGAWWIMPETSNNTYTMTCKGPGGIIQKSVSTVLPTTTVTTTTGTTVTPPGTTVTPPGTTVTPPGTTVTPPGTTVTPPGTTVTPPGTTVTPPGTTVTPPGTTVTPPGTTVTPPGTTVDVPPCVSPSCVITPGKEIVVPPGTSVDITITTINMDPNTVCSVLKTSSGGTPFPTRTEPCSTLDNGPISTGSLVPGDYTYKVIGDTNTIPLYVRFTVGKKTYRPTYQEQ